MKVIVEQGQKQDVELPLNKMEIGQVYIIMVPGNNWFSKPGEVVVRARSEITFPQSGTWCGLEDTKARVRKLRKGERVIITNP